MLRLAIKLAISVAITLLATQIGRRGPSCISGCFAGRERSTGPA